ncbi:YafY family transcriptional regulator [Streptomyces sp. LX-29]|uniref:helix-turn-helix transcriptional regulator n=1 Tax=Streptomyces sp. LX-29 TaxID=2900152 RepID=UPI00240E3F5D|nr:YafY family protein [Streptomyces sp. LX-29]WFB08177.1 YafY family transcriptional regulator [Streptomyces sp. LX-29]
MNRTERLYAIVEELRAASPRPLSARRLADRFEVSVRTVERDLAALRQAGVPLYAEPGRTGGHALDRTHTLPPLTITPVEATALAAGLHALEGTPFAEAARTALRKVVAVLPAREREAVAACAARVQLVAPATGLAPVAVPRLLQEALTHRRVLHLTYADRHGRPTDRDVEPLGYLRGAPDGREAEPGRAAHWYLIAWCRLRGAVRGFRLDRIREVTAVDEVAPERGIDLAGIDALGHRLTGLPELTPSAHPVGPTAS